jgi:protocatechuate 3,4-dioxygenase beta subunit
MERALKIALSFVLLGFAGSSVLGDCKCGRPLEGETTHWGGNESIELEQKSTLKMVQGRVEYGGRPLRGALVEVFASEGRIPIGNDEKSEQKRLATCKTAEDGEFCFKNLPSGRYEIRSSMDTGWDVTRVVVTVDTKNGRNERLHLPMYLGT